jgi:DNA (cytosine-5)-methyltransferase 1
MFTHGSLFAGIGGFEIAFNAAGFKTLWYSEIEPYPCHVLARRFPNAANVGDIYQTHPPYVDVITAGFPCQPFSDAGKKRGTDDERYLVPEMLRVIQEVEPRVVLLENVPGFRTINDGNEFRELLRQIAEMGYDAEWGHLRASSFGAPHRRERLFIVAHTDRANGKARCANSMGDGQRKKRPSTCCSELAHASRPRLEGWARQRGNNAAQQSPAKRSGYKLARTLRGGHNGGRYRTPQNADRYGASRKPRQAEPGLGRGAYGFPYRVDGHQFPAPPGPQYSWEPPRTTDRTENRAARLKALGNAVVPQVVYPLAVSIMEWLSNETL